MDKKYFIFSALNQLQQPQRNADTWCKDEGISKKLKNHIEESQVPEEREEKKENQEQKGKETDVRTHYTHISGEDKNHTIYNKLCSILY